MSYSLQNGDTCKVPTLSKMHCMRMENGVVQLLSQKKNAEKSNWLHPKPFWETDPVFQNGKWSFKKIKPPKSHDSSCVAVNITLQTLLLFDYFTGVQGDLSLQIILKTLNAQPKCFPQQSAICCFNFPCSIERFSKSVSSVSAL